jgi:hypothetical protein
VAQHGVWKIRRRGVRRDYDSADPARRRSLFGWSLVLGSIALMVISGAIWLWLLPQMHRRSELGLKSAALEEARVRVASRFPSPSEAEALRFVKRAAANRDPSQVASLFHPGGAEAAEVVDFCRAAELRDGPAERYEWLGSLDAHDVLLEGVLVVFKGREKPVERLALLTPDAEGNWKVDFDAFARSVTPSWDVVLGKRDNVPSPKQALVRVLIAKDYYFNGPFRDDAEWACYGIASPDIDELLRGYCRVGSPEQLALEKLLEDGERMRRATLELTRVENAEARQFEITRILAKDWVMAKPDVNKG